MPEDIFAHIPSKKTEASGGDIFAHIPSVEQSAKAPGVARTALDHYANSVSGGYLPHLQALGGKAVDYLTDSGGSVRDPRTGEIIEDKTPQSRYVDLRDEGIARLKAEAEANPNAALAGKVGGIVNQAALLPAANGWKAAGLLGARLGVAQNPGDLPGVVDPAQLEDRAINGVAGGVVGGVLGRGMDYLKGRAAVQPFLRLTGNPKEFQDVANTEFQGAIEKLNQEHIAPKSEALLERIKGKTININPDDLERAGFVEEAKNLRQTGANYGVSGTRWDIPAEEGLRLKQKLDAANNWGRLRSGTDVEANQNQIEAISQAADKLRKQINDIPGAKRLNESLHEAMTYRGRIEDLARKPIAGLTTKSADNLADIQNFDAIAGTTLSDTAKRAAMAKKLSAEFSIMHPQRAVDYLLTQGTQYLPSAATSPGAQSLATAAMHSNPDLLRMGGIAPAILGEALLSRSHRRGF